VFEGKLQRSKAHVFCSVLQVCCKRDAVLQVYCSVCRQLTTRHSTGVLQCVQCVASVLQCCKCVAVFEGKLQPSTAHMRCSVCSVLQACCSVASVLTATYNQVKLIFVAVCNTLQHTCAVCCKCVAVLHVLQCCMCAVCCKCVAVLHVYCSV